MLSKLISGILGIEEQLKKRDQIAIDIDRLQKQKEEYETQIEELEEQKEEVEEELNEDLAVAQKIRDIRKRKREELARQRAEQQKASQSDLEKKLQSSSQTKQAIPQVTPQTKQIREQEISPTKQLITQSQSQTKPTTQLHIQQKENEQQSGNNILDKENKIRELGETIKVLEDKIRTYEKQEQDRKHMGSESFESGSRTVRELERKLIQQTNQNTEILTKKDSQIETLEEKVRSLNRQIVQITQEKQTAQQTYATQIKEMERKYEEKLNTQKQQTEDGKRLVQVAGSEQLRRAVEQIEQQMKKQKQEDNERILKLLKEKGDYETQITQLKKIIEGKQGQTDVALPQKQTPLVQTIRGMQKQNLQEMPQNMVNGKISEGKLQMKIEELEKQIERLALIIYEKDKTKIIGPKKSSESFSTILEHELKVFRYDKNGFKTTNDPNADAITLIRKYGFKQFTSPLKNKSAVRATLEMYELNPNSCFEFLKNSVLLNLSEYMFNEINKFMKEKQQIAKIVPNLEDMTQTNIEFLLESFIDDKKLSEKIYEIYKRAGITESKTTMISMNALNFMQNYEPMLALISDQSHDVNKFAFFLYMTKSFFDAILEMTLSIQVRNLIRIKGTNEETMQLQTFADKIKSYIARNYEAVTKTNETILPLIYDEFARETSKSHLEIVTKEDSELTKKQTDNRASTHLELIYLGARTTYQIYLKKRQKRFMIKGKEEITFATFFTHVMENYFKKLNSAQLKNVHFMPTLHFEETNTYCQITQFEGQTPIVYFVSPTQLVREIMKPETTTQMGITPKEIVEILDKEYFVNVK